MKRGLVVAKYEEDVSWIDKVPADIKVYIYDKSKLPKPKLAREFEYKRIRNVGRDPGTFLYHIVEHYDELDDYVAFAQGHPFDHYPEKLFFRDLNKEVDYAELGNVVFNVIGRGSLDTGNLELTQVFMEISGREQFSFEFAWGMQVLLSKRLILRRPVKFYLDLCNRAEQLYKKKRTLPILERIWRAIWYDLERELK